MPLDPSAFLADPELLGVLSQHAQPVDCATDRVLFCQDDPVSGLYILHEGRIALSMTSQGGKTILSAEAKDGSLLGLPGLISKQPYSLTAVAHSGAKVSFLDHDAFTALMESGPELSFKILRVLAAEVRAARYALF